MKTRYVESIPCQSLKDITHLDVEVYYKKGGMSYFSGGIEKRFAMPASAIPLKGGLGNAA